MLSSFLGGRSSRGPALKQLVLTVAVLGFWLQHAIAKPLLSSIESRAELPREFSKRHANPPAKRGPPNGGPTIPLHIINNCQEPIWPGVLTQAGTGPGIGGFELEHGKMMQLEVGPDWIGRVWGRTNCTVSGNYASCMTGGCGNLMDCTHLSGEPPATLLEVRMGGGTHGHQTFYDISLVDGYNLPMAVNYIPRGNTSYIPPNLTNLACIATPGWLSASSPDGTIYSNDSFPIPWETFETDQTLANWCPWEYLKFPPTKPSDGIYAYPDDKAQRPIFSPCKSACGATKLPQYCCTGPYNVRGNCHISDYSVAAKAVCPDAYSFALDDNKSVFKAPTGGGYEVVLCPKGRSTNILQQLRPEMEELAGWGQLSEASLRNVRDANYVNMDRSVAAGQVTV